MKIPLLTASRPAKRPVGVPKMPTIKTPKAQDMVKAPKFGAVRKAPGLAKMPKLAKAPKMWHPGSEPFPTMHTSKDH